MILLYIMVSCILVPRRNMRRLLYWQGKQSMSKIYTKKKPHNVYTIYVWGRIQIHLKTVFQRNSTRRSHYFGLPKQETAHGTRHFSIWKVPIYIYTVLRGFYHTGFAPFRWFKYPTRNIWWIIVFITTSSSNCSECILLYK